jgi:hypothetical protein
MSFLRPLAAIAVTVLSVGFAIVPELLGAEAGGVSGHHLRHAVLILGGAIAGVLIRPPAKDPVREHAGWLAPTVLAPVAAMLVMWPTTYDYIEAHPPFHVLEHLVILALGVVTSYAGERYARGMGWVTGALLVLMAIGAAFGYGVVFGSS